MCGITGIIDINEKGLISIIGKMTTFLRHRGPDDAGTWVDEKNAVALGHTRLSILDLSPEGHQPMVSSSGRYVVSYNGEVYNFKTLGLELESEGFKFRGHSDTEVVLACFERWGVDEATKRFIGMFAFALWDRVEKKLHLVRDRMGIKPLYFGWSEKSFMFGSELKTFYGHPKFRPELDRDNITLFLRSSCIPAPYSIYKNIYKLLPGCILTISRDDIHKMSDFSPYPDDKEASLRPRRYWSSYEIMNRASKDQYVGPEDEAVEQLEKVLLEAVGMRMISDVPLGAFLSGGIDSSLVVALMQSQSVCPVKTFTIGFREREFNEAEHAKAVAGHLGTDHTELYVTPREAMDVVHHLGGMFDEPFADSSQIPTYLVSALTKKHVTVSLSGDGGDELFGGYTRHVSGRAVWNKFGWLPQILRRMIAAGITSLNPEQWNNIFDGLEFLIPRKSMVSLPGDKAHKLAHILRENSPEKMYSALVSHWQDCDKIVLNAKEPITMSAGHPKELGFAQHVMYLDAITYLPNDILTKVDRTSMSVSLEARVPLLDHRVVEFAWRLPLSMKIRNGCGKWLLRRLLNKYVPEVLVDRPKMGFSMPVGKWLRGGLRDWAEELLSEKRLRDENFFDPKPILAKWSDHLNGRGNWQHELWDVLMFQSWNAQRRIAG